METEDIKFIHDFDIVEIGSGLNKGHFKIRPLTKAGEKALEEYAGYLFKEYFLEAFLFEKFQKFCVRRGANSFLIAPAPDEEELATKLKIKLQAIGFVAERPDLQDRDYVVYRKDYRHPILKNLHICVDNEYISVFCLDVDHNHDVIICKNAERTTEALFDILVGLKILEG